MEKASLTSGISALFFILCVIPSSLPNICKGLLPMYYLNTYFHRFHLFTIYSHAMLHCTIFSPLIIFSNIMITLTYICLCLHIPLFKDNAEGKIPFQCTTQAVTQYFLNSGTEYMQVQQIHKFMTQPDLQHVQEVCP